MARDGLLNAFGKYMQSALIDSSFILDDGASGAGAGYTTVGTDIAQVGAANAYAIAWEGNLDDASPVRQWYAWLQIISTDFTTGDETHQLNIEESDTTAFTVVRKTTWFKLYPKDLTPAAILEGLLCVPFTPQYKYFRYTYTNGGTTPVLKVGKGWATPITNC